jgi:two-component system, OmpR family, sensor histidine kinase VanS
VSRPRGLSVRAKLTLSYAALLVLAGIALFGVGLLLLRFVPDGALYSLDGVPAPNRSNLLEAFVRYAAWAIGLLMVFGLVGGWFLAGFVLRPLRLITDAAGAARDGRWGQRVTLAGRGDELTDLADTFDAMLDRVERTLEEERRFAANASHELRTPLAVIRTVVEVARADPDGRDVEVVLQRVADTNDRAIDTVESLLALARIGRGEPLRAEPVDVAALLVEALDAAHEIARAREVRAEVALSPAVVAGDPPLLARLAANLVHNAVVHNARGGWVQIAVRSMPDGAELLVRNGGDVIDEAVARTLTEPFVRGAGRARGAAGHEGSGLGLAIVASIVRAHAGRLRVDALPAGGLQVRVLLPR